MHDETRGQSEAGASQQRNARGAGDGQTRRQMRVDVGNFVKQPARDREQREDRQARDDQLELISSIAQPIHCLGISPEMRFGFLVFHQGLLPPRMHSCQLGATGDRAELWIGEGHAPVLPQSASERTDDGR